MNARHAALLLALLAAGCASHTPAPVARPAPARSSPIPPSDDTRNLPPAKPEQIPKQIGGYYQDDGPVLDVPYDLDALPEPVPRLEPLNKYANRPYSVLGKTYTPRKELGGFVQEGMASWYGKKFHGKRTSSGENYDLFKLTAAHPILPIPSYARVTSLASGKSVVVRINDRGPFHKDRVIDLSYTAAYRLGFQNGGSGQVRVEALLPGEEAKASAPETNLLKSVEAAPGRPVSNGLGADPLLALAEQGGREPPAKPVVEAGEQRWVQLGAFGTQTGAEAFRAKAAEQLAWLGTEPVVEASGQVWRVRLGPYSGKAEAQQVADRITARADLRPVVVH
ncbi:septal ring lytic transglycosylase RlpA family protein [Chitinimonas sp.]|uniref:septal ring lytic transglycosylase RlpA family protein n=1 Tax=Chitinimonas sp. TaxID=1934313 RepID=UPI002F94EA59